MKIAVSGVGIAGPTLAYWLSRSGHEPVLIETSPQFRTGGYVVDFWGAGYAIAERMGLAPAVQATGYAIDEVRLIDRNGSKTGGFGVGPFRRVFDGRFTSVPRGELARLIYQAIGADVETVFNEHITVVDQRDDGVQVTFAGGLRREFDLVIGADGIHSSVRGAVFGPESQFTANLGYWVAACETAGYRPRDELVYLAYTQPGRMVARFALRGDRTMFLFVFSDDRVRAGRPGRRAGWQSDPAAGVRRRRVGVPTDSRRGGPGRRSVLRSGQSDRHGPLVGRPGGADR